MKTRNLEEEENKRRLLAQIRKKRDSTNFLQDTYFKGQPLDKKAVECSCVDQSESTQKDDNYLANYSMTTLSEAFEEDGSPSPKKIRNNYEIFLDSADAKSDGSQKNSSLLKLQQCNGEDSNGFNYVSPMKKNYFEDDLMKSPSQHSIHSEDNAGSTTKKPRSPTKRYVRKRTTKDRMEKREQLLSESKMINE